MKRFVYLALPFFVAVIFASCSSNSPRSVAEKALDCAMKEDYRGYLDLVYFSDADKEKKESYIRMIEEKAEKNQDQDNPKIESYKFVSEEIDEEEGCAKETFEVNYDNGSSREQSVDLIRADDGKWYIKMKK